MIANWVIEGDLKNKFLHILHNKLALLFISFYIIHLLGLLYTQNLNSGLFDIQVKLSLLIFPVIFSSKPFDESKTRIIGMMLIIGGIIASTIMLSRSIYLLYSNGENTFFYQTFSIFLHPSYLSMYLNISISWILISISQNNLPKKQNRYLILVILLFSVVIILLASKSGIFTLTLTFLLFLSYLILYKKNYKMGAIVLIGFVGILFFVFHYFPFTSKRITQLTEAFENKDIKNNEVVESTSMRMLIWKASNSVIKNNFALGVGTGDSKDELIKEYKKRDMTYAVSSNLNAHNAFYQVFISLGVGGFLLLCLNLLIPLLSSLKNKNFFYLSFILILTFNFLSESMLECQAGTMFFGFFNSLLCFYKPKQ